MHLFIILLVINNRTGIIITVISILVTELFSQPNAINNLSKTYPCLVLIIIKRCQKNSGVLPTNIISQHHRPISYTLQLN